MAGDLACAAGGSDGVCALRLAFGWGGGFQISSTDPNKRATKSSQRALNAEGAEFFAKERREKLSFLRTFANSSASSAFKEVVLGKLMTEF